MEVPLCGHATLAAAAAIFNGTENAADCLFFDTLSGELSVKRDAATGMLSMDLPLLEPGSNLPSEDFEANSELIQAALSGTPAVQVEEILFEPSLRYLVVRLGTAKGTEISRDQFEATQPNIARMHAAHAGGQLVGIILTVPGPEGGPHDFLSRFFAPWAGIEEDPVTGSAHSVLGPLWTKRLGKSELAARQCSKRGGELKVVVDFERHRVVVKGEAAMVVRGELLV